MVAIIAYPIVLALEELIPYAIGAAAVGVGAATIAKNPPPRPFWDSYEGPATPPLPIELDGLDLNLDGFQPWQPPTIIKMDDGSAPDAPPVDGAEDAGPGTPTPPQPPLDPNQFREALRRLQDSLSRRTTPITGTISTALKFISSHWYLRFAPVYLGFGYSAGRTALESHQQEEESAKLRTPVPEQLRQLVATTEPSLADAIKVVHQYAYDMPLMDVLIPKMFQNVYSPQGALVLAHCLLESFSLNPSVNTDMKDHYLQRIERELNLVISRFAESMILLKKDVDTPNELFSSSTDLAQDVTISGHIVSPGITMMMSDFQVEKVQLMAMAKEHARWIQSPELALPETVVQRMNARLAVMDHRLSLDWGHIQTKISDGDSYMSGIREGFTAIRHDFVHKNRDVVDMAVSNLMGGDGWGSTIGFLTASVFLKTQSGLGFFFQSMPFIAASNTVFGANAAAKQSAIHQPIKFCLPDFGTNCDDI